MLTYFWVSGFLAGGWIINWRPSPPFSMSRGPWFWLTRRSWFFVVPPEFSMDLEAETPVGVLPHGAHSSEFARGALAAFKCGDEPNGADCDFE